jgi:hypothetical protein
MQDDRDFFVRDGLQNIRGLYACPIKAMRAMRRLGPGASVVRLSDRQLIGFAPRSASDWGQA